ncbi:helix-turn-helix domain-containing protein [Streptomyces rimosus]|uniref:helix-turn-helix domain-containing protein n=1 Tax=Streptomyces rimosus TaxID=1927 RepID=UPI0004C6E13D|nr:helix-turn-helix transcriptional regulator [Streptomyces rimosus]
MEPPPATYQVNGAAIRAIRMRQGLALRETARAAGISRSYLQRLETGTRRRMRPDTYAPLRNYLGATDDQLLAQEESTEKR